MTLAARCLVQALACVALALPASAQPESETQKPIALEIIEHFRERSGDGFSGVVLVAMDGEVQFEEAFGYRDPEHRILMRTTDIFDIGSIVKPMTAAAIYLLEAEGHLSASDSITAHFADVPEDKQAITIQHLLDHRAGLQDYFGEDYELISRSDMLELILDSELIAPIGGESHYSNCGYTMLAMIVENVSGKAYEEFITTRIIKPAGGQRIGYTLPAWYRDELTVGMRGDERFGTPLDHAWYGDGPSWHLRGCGGMLSSVRDLYEFSIALDSDPNVLPAAARERWHAHYVRELDEQRVYGVLGGNGYFNSMCIRNLDTGLTIVAMSNISEHQAEDSLKFLRPLLTR